jgi:4-carboxymuconolactone decarboxylase
MNVLETIGVVVLAGAAAAASGAPSGTSSRTGPRAQQPAVAQPPDIYPESGNRLPLPNRDEMDDEGKEAFDRLQERGPLAVGAAKPSPRLYSPALARPLGESARYLKFETGLPAPLVEVAVLITARESTCQYEWTQWEEHGRNPKDPRHLEGTVIDIIKHDRPLAGLDEKETAIIALGREMLGEKHVSSSTFAQVLRLFGRKGTVDLIGLMTGYAACAVEMPTLNQQLLPGQTPLLPANSIPAPRAVLRTLPAPRAMLPGDIYPDSRNRLPLPNREEMSAEDRKSFDELTRDGRLPGTLGPTVRFYSPRLAKPLAEAHRYVTDHSGLSDTQLAIAVLATARARDSQYLWTQWETFARIPGDPRRLDPAVIDLLKYEKTVAGLGEKEIAIIALVREAFGARQVSSVTFADVVRLFGRKGTIDLMGVMTVYASDAAVLTAFDQQLQDGQRPLLPPRAPR